MCSGVWGGLGSSLGSDDRAVGRGAGLVVLDMGFAAPWTTTPMG